MSGRLKGGEFAVMRRIIFAFGPDIDEETVLAVDSGIRERFAVDRNQALAVLAGGLRDQLLGPGAKIGDLG